MKKILLILLLLPFLSSAQLSLVASKSFGTITDLRAQSGTNNVQVLLQGQNTITDQNGGTYYWNSSSTATDDGFTVIKVTNVTTGRWLRMISNNTLKGNVTFSGTLLQTAYVVNHSLGFIPAQVIIQPRSANAAAYSYVSNLTTTTFTINFLTVPIIGSNNISFDFLLLKQ